MKPKRCKICDHKTVEDGRCSWCGTADALSSRISENNIRDGIVQWLNAERHAFAWANETVGIWDAKRKAYRRNAKRLRGVSDILGVLPDGRLLALEVKKGRNVMTEEQEHFLMSVRQSGGVADDVRCIRDVEGLLGLRGKQDDIL